MKKLQLSSGLKNIAKVSTGTILGQIISILVLPIYTRIYGASIIGDWTLFTSISVIVGTFSDLGLMNAIMIEKEEKSVELYQVVTTIVLFFSVMASIAVGVYYYLFPHESGIAFWFFAIIVGLLIFTMQQINVCYAWLNRKKQYNVLMKNAVINNLSAAIIAVTLGLLGYTKYGYYIGLTVGQIVTLFHMKRKLPKGGITLNFGVIKAVVQRHQDFVRYQMPTNMSTQIKNQLPTLLIRFFFGSEILGYYAVSNKVLYMPITFLANSIGKVYYQTVAEMQRKGEAIGEYTLRNMRRAMKLAAIPMVIILSCADWVCKIVLGDSYAPAGIICQIVCFNSFFIFLMQSTQGIAVVTRKQKYALISSLIQSVGYLVGFSVGKYVFNSIYVGCAIMSMIFCLAQIIYFSAIYKVVGVKPIRYVKSTVGTVIAIVFGAAVIRLILILIGIV